MTYGRSSEGYAGWFLEELGNLVSWSLASQALSLAERCNMVKHPANELYIFADLCMPQIGALGVSSPVFLLFLVSLERKEIQVPPNIIYWANTEIGELLVNSSFLLLFNPAPHWLQEVETSSFCKRSPKTRPLVSSGCFCSSKAKGKLFHWSEQHQAHSHLQHWSALKYN